MKKLFVSVPMKGRTEEEIKNNMDYMHKIAEAAFGEELEMIDTYIDYDAPENSISSVWYLGESLKKLATADCFVGVADGDLVKTYTGCFIEGAVAMEYGIPHYFISSKRLGI